MYYSGTTHAAVHKLLLNIMLKLETQLYNGEQSSAYKLPVYVAMNLQVQNIQLQYWYVMQ